MTLILTVIVLHWIGDFVFQSDWMAQNKSKSNKALSLHVLAYTSVFFVILLPLFSFSNLISYLAVNAALHFVVDHFTSQITARLWAKGDRHNFFVVIGFDQLLHYMCLILTLWILR